MTAIPMPMSARVLTHIKLLQRARATARAEQFEGILREAMREMDPVLLSLLLSQQLTSAQSSASIFLSLYFQASGDPRRMETIHAASIEPMLPADTLAALRTVAERDAILIAAQWPAVPAPPHRHVLDRTCSGGWACECGEEFEFRDIGRRT